MYSGTCKSLTRSVPHPIVSFRDASLDYPRLPTSWTYPSPIVPSHQPSQLPPSLESQGDIFPWPCFCSSSDITSFTWRFSERGSCALPLLPHLMLTPQTTPVSFPTILWKAFAIEDNVILVAKASGYFPILTLFNLEALSTVDFPIPEQSLPLTLVTSHLLF